MEVLRVCYLLATITCILIEESSQQLVAPPSAFQEHWHDHHGVVIRVYFNNDIAVYHDLRVNPLLTWPSSFVTAVWQHMKSVYYINNQKLYVVIHSDRLDVGEPSTYLQDERGYRNIIDIDLGDLAQWPIEVSFIVDMMTSQVTSIVENVAYGVAGNPASNISRSRLAEILIYDVYNTLERSADATRWYQSKLNNVDDFPRNGTMWFKDWFYPIYKKYGGNLALRRFFSNLYSYFPKANNAYTRMLNMGEFVHFWSGAANKNLKTLATTVFGWSNATEVQLLAAKAQFRFIYPD